MTVVKDVDIRTEIGLSCTPSQRSLRSSLKNERRSLKEAGSTLSAQSTITEARRHSLSSARRHA